jgi:hypothetical protein
MSSQESAYGTGIASSMANAAPDEVIECADELMENSNFAATKAVEIAADGGPRPGHVLHEVWGAEGGGAVAGGGAGASANNQSIPIRAMHTALINHTAEPTATALATGVHCTDPSFTKYFESGLKTSNLQCFLTVRARGGECPRQRARFSLGIVYHAGGLAHKKTKGRWCELIWNVDEMKEMKAKGGETFATKYPMSCQFLNALDAQNEVAKQRGVRQPEAKHSRLRH